MSREWLRAAADSLAVRIDALTRVVRYEPKRVADQVQLDLARTGNDGTGPP